MSNYKNHVFILGEKARDIKLCEGSRLFPGKFVDAVEMPSVYDENSKYAEVAKKHKDYIEKWVKESNDVALFEIDPQKTKYYKLKELIALKRFENKLKTFEIYFVSTGRWGEMPEEPSEYKRREIEINDIEIIKRKIAEENKD